MRSKYLFFLFLGFGLCNFSAFAAKKQWGVGAVVGAPTGLSVNYFLDETRSIQSVAAFDFDGRDEINLASHLTWWKRDVDTPIKPLFWFYGFGGEMVVIDQSHKKSHDKHFELGPSGTVGLFYPFKTVPTDVFLKSNLTLNIIETTNADLDLMLGLHYNF